jgi:hypothetical protein
MKRTLAVLAFFVAAVLAGLFVNYSVAALPPATKETFMQRERGMPLDMVASGVQGAEAASPILGSTPRPISEKPYEIANETEMFQFSGNKMGADCCPSPFSGDLGCICLTDAQKQTFASRGGNRSV